MVATRGGSDEELPLEGMNVLITGATGGIGKATVMRVASLGGHPIIHFRGNESSARQLADDVDGCCTLVRADLQEQDGAIKLWDSAAASVGQIHALVNNAGLRSTARVTDAFSIWSRAWTDDLQVNLVAPASLAKLAIPHFQKHGGGRIINIASRAGQRGYTADYMP